VIPVLNKRFDQIPAGAVYVGRPSKYGNPYSHLDGSTGTIRVDTRQEAVAMFSKSLKEELKKDPSFLDDLRYATALVCWCAPAECHAMVLARAIDVTS
jgi:hypothetical protein